MTALRTIIAGGRKRIGLLVGAGAPAGMKNVDGTYPLIPAVAGLT
ncbi:MAG: SIR2 family protein, partial [Hyphomicrobiales bacterium]